MKILLKTLEKNVTSHKPPLESTFVSASSVDRVGRFNNGPTLFVPVKFCILFKLVIAICKCSAARFDLSLQKCCIPHVGTKLIKQKGGEGWGEGRKERNPLP
jgi:hypothetical protein